MKKIVVVLWGEKYLLDAAVTYIDSLSREELKEKIFFLREKCELNSVVRDIQKINEIKDIVTNVFKFHGGVIKTIEFVID